MRRPQEILQKVYNAFYSRQRNGKTLYFLHEDEGWLRDLLLDLWNAHYGDNNAYAMVRDVAGQLSEYDLDTWDAYRDDPLLEIEPDVYTHDLTEWLHDTHYNVHYVTQAIEVFGITDGFKALSAAQQIALQEVAHRLIDYLEERYAVEEMEDE